MLVAQKLSVDHKTRPLGCDVLRPNLSWIVTSLDPCQRGKHQSAYRIVAASSLDALGREQPDLWDSHKVRVPSSFGVLYEGKHLDAAAATYIYWKVMLWDEKGQPGPWSDTEFWQVGLLNPAQDWRAEWISSPEEQVSAILAKPPSTAQLSAAGPAALHELVADPAQQASVQDPIQGSVQHSVQHSVQDSAEGAAEKAVDESGVDSPPKALLLPAPQHFLTEFELEAVPVRATLVCTAKGIYKMFLNGAAVGADYFTPGWTDYNVRHYYNMYDVTSELRVGANAIGAIVADGWYAGYIGWKEQRDHYGSSVALLAQLVLECADGSRRVVGATSNSWKCREGPTLEADFLMGETYDAQRELDGWSTPGFDTRRWHHVEATPLGEAAAKLQVHPSYPVQAIHEFTPKEVTSPEPGVFIFNLGQNFAGIVRLKVEGAKAGDTIVLRFGERLQDDGKLYTENLRTARATDTYICKGSPTEIWQPLFTFHGFQYVEMKGYPGDPPRSAITGIALSSATPRVGWLQTSDPQVNQLLNNIWWTQRSNFIDLPTDCPQRDERLGWTGDAQVYIRTACYFTDLQAFFHKWLRDLRDAQADSGEFPMFAPLPEKLLDILGVAYAKADDGGPGWADAGALCPWRLYEVYGDIDILQASFPSMVKFVDFCVNRCDSDLNVPSEFHCFGDWLNADDKTPKEVMYTGMLGASVAATRDAAAVLGHEEEAARLQQLWERVKEAFARQFVEEEGYKITGDTQCAYVLPLAYDLLAENHKAAAFKRLLELIQARDWHLSTGFIGTGLLLLVLDKFDRNDVAYQLLHNSTYPSWGFSIKNGATSIWERWNGWTPEQGFGDPSMNSLAHYSFGAVGQWLVEVVGGIRAAAPGFTRVIICPKPGGLLTWVNCSYDAKTGHIISNWKIQDGRLIMEVGVPPGVAATIYVPCSNPDQVQADGHVKANLQQVGTCCTVEVGSGTYDFIVPYSVSKLPNSPDLV